MHRLDGGDRRHAGARAPGQEFRRGAVVGPAPKNSGKRIDARSPATATSTAKPQQTSLSGQAGSCAFLRCCVDRSPAVIQKLAARAVESEPVSAVRRWLVVAAIDRQS